MSRDTAVFTPGRPRDSRSLRSVKVAVVAESRPGERRVALVPGAVGPLTGAGLDVVVESAAGRHVYAADADYRDAGATVEIDPLAEADVVLSVRPLAVQRLRRLRHGAITIGFLPPGGELEVVAACRDGQITSFSLDLLPRLSRAQGMDALSSQALVSGYRAVLVAAERLPRFFPLFMTAAGTVPPARVFVLGAGVAGLQAIATARRLGAVVQAYDVRAAAAEEVRSLGGRFVELPLEQQAGASGYAAMPSEEKLGRQRELVGRHVAESDVVITAAAVPGRRAPLLVTAQMVEAMRPGSVVVDLSAESGGNCELALPGQEVRHHGVLVWGAANVPSDMPVHASQMYARNVANLLLLMTRDGWVEPDLSDEVLAACCVTHAGQVRHEPTRALLGRRAGEEADRGR